ncbi:MAG: DUF3999 family protein [Burkholderiales bacterium]|nr:DUF3999 family protein [Burkholderiales bacterium]
MQTERPMASASASAALRRQLPPWAALALLLLPGLALRAEPPALRYSAPVQVVQPAPFVQLALPVGAYARSRHGDLADLRLVDAQAQAVPFTLLAPREEALETREALQPVALFALPRRPEGDALPASLELTVHEGRVQLRQRGGPVTAPQRSAGWLFDLGEPAPEAARPTALVLRWAGPAEFSVAYALEFSDDLRLWRRGPRGQVMALAAPAGAATPASAAPGALTQPRITLDGARERFVRLVWADAAQAPQLVGAQAVMARHERVPRDALAELRLSASPASDPREPAVARGLQLDLGAVLPLRSLALELPEGTWVLPLRVQGRERDGEPWRELGQGVAYRLGREDGSVSLSPPLALHATVRHLRLLPDERAPALDAARTPVRLQVALASLVFAAQGTPPYRLLAGAADPTRPGALPATTLVPRLDDERPRFGRATLGEWVESPEVARDIARQEAWARARPWLLWAVLLAGVAGLALMVWRMARGRAAG